MLCSAVYVHTVFVLPMYGEKGGVGGRGGVE